MRRGPAAPARHAVLAHGYTDYFSHRAGRPLRRPRPAFYALDLHKCGRFGSRARPAHSPPTWRPTTASWAGGGRHRGGAGRAGVASTGHSAGGLIVTLWLDRLRDRGPTAALGVDGLVLNSPFLDLGTARRSCGPPDVGRADRPGQRCKTSVVRKPTEGGYGTTLHRDYAGEFDYDLTLKPLGGFPVTFGWINAVRRVSAVAPELDVGVPNLILRSTTVSPRAPARSRWPRRRRARRHTSPAGRGLRRGTHTTVAPIVDAKHDVFLSLTAPRRGVRRANSTGGWIAPTTQPKGPDVQHFDLTIIGTVRATAFSTIVTPGCGSRSANRAPSAAPA